MSIFIKVLLSQGNFDEIRKSKKKKILSKLEPKFSDRISSFDQRDQMNSCFGIFRKTKKKKRLKRIKRRMMRTILIAQEKRMVKIKIKRSIKMKKMDDRN